MYNRIIFASMDLRTLGRNIAFVRKLQGVTQEDVAFSLNISGTSYAKIERGETNVSFMRLVQIADYFKVDVIELLCMQNASDANSMQSEVSYIKQKVDEIDKDIRELKKLI